MTFKVTCGYCGQGLDGAWDTVRHYWLSHTIEGRVTKWLRSKIGGRSEGDDG